MINRLRKRFIALSMATMLLVLGVILGMVNLLSYRHVVQDADAVLTVLADNGGRFPMPEGEMPPPDGQTIPPAPMGEDYNNDDAEIEADTAFDPGARDDMFRRDEARSKEMPYESRYFTVTADEAGTVLAVDTGMIAAVDSSAAKAYAEEVLASGKTRGFADDYRYLVSGTGSERMVLFLDCGRNLDTFRSFLLSSLGVAALGLLAVLLLLVLFSGRVIRPIAESYEKQKRFITDAGHELKTPITIIQADADVLASELEAEDNEWITDIRRQTHRLSALTSELIYLSKMEEADAALRFQEFSLSELTDETARSFRSRALKQGKRFSQSVAPDLRMNGDEAAVAKLVSILMDNAMKYSPADGEIALTLERAGKNARLTVRNSTLPMEKGSADHLFDRFSRADSSRSSQTGGFGLGLAIAKAVTEAHKGRIHAESEDGASLTVTAELPLV